VIIRVYQRESAVRQSVAASRFPVPRFGRTAMRPYKESVLLTRNFVNFCRDSSYNVVPSKRLQTLLAAEVAEDTETKKG
jgi:hypothetical protein